MLNLPSYPRFDSSVTNSVELVVAGARYVTSIRIDNPNAAKRYLQLFDAEKIADVTLGSTAPTFVIPVLSSSIENEDITQGIAFRKGICYAFTDTASGAGSPGTAASVSLGISEG